MRKFFLVLCTIVWGGGTYAVNVTSYYKPAQYQEARYKEAQYEASYQAAQYSEANSNLNWNNSMLDRKITIKSYTPITSRDFNVSVTTPAFKTASGQVPHVLGGGASGEALGLRESNDLQTPVQAQYVTATSSQTQAFAPQPQAEGDDVTTIEVNCPTCGDYIGTIKITKERGLDSYKVNAEASRGWAWIWELIKYIFGASTSYDQAYAKALSLKEEMIEKHSHECKGPGAPIGDGALLLITCLAGYAVYSSRKRRKEVAD